ncbi:MAG: hypothetical protein NT113_17980 [Hyphomicrobiales bacterium]|nr:hypothetical protein [Hyphomicrobiales bacterium]
MSSKPMAARSRPKLRTPEADAHVHVAAPQRAAKKKGRRQPKADEFQVVVDLPLSPPIHDAELRAIEILLGRELQDLLTGVATDPPENSH